MAASNIFFPILLAITVIWGTTTNEKELAAGEKMYRTGVLSGGGMMKVVSSGRAEVPGSTFACASCHTRSGLGAMDEGLKTLPINGARLFQPRYPNFQILTVEERKSLPERFQVPPIRPAYSDQSLAVAIREGVEAGGHTLSSVMPRYEMDDADMKILINYLRRLSAQPSSGVTDSTMAFATVITDEVSKADQDAMLGPLEASIQGHNNLGRNKGHMGRMLSMQEMRNIHREWTLDKWVLTGRPETWKSQLEKYYKKNPVFALVGGISTLPWHPIHRFCETNGIPCILPITDLPVISTADYYTVYFTKGYYQEGEAVARYMDKNYNATHPSRIVQILSPGPEAEALAMGFQNMWSELGHEKVDTIIFKKDNTRSILTSKDSGSICLLWTGSESYDILKSFAGMAKRPTKVFMSSTRLMGGIWELPSEVRGFTYLAYSFRDPGPTSVFTKMSRRPKIVNKEFRKNDRRITSKTNTMFDILTNRILAMERNFYRDHLVDLFGMMEEQKFTDYEKLIFNQGQNYGSEECSIMQLSEGENPKLVRVKD